MKTNTCRLLKPPELTMSKPEVVLFLSSNQIAVFSSIMPKALVYGCMGVRVFESSKGVFLI